MPVCRRGPGTPDCAVRGGGAAKNGRRGRALSACAFDPVSFSSLRRPSPSPRARVACIRYVSVRALGTCRVSWMFASCRESICALVSPHLPRAWSRRCAICCPALYVRVSIGMLLMAGVCVARFGQRIWSQLVTLFWPLQPLCITSGAERIRHRH